MGRIAGTGVVYSKEHIDCAPVGRVAGRYGVLDGLSRAARRCSILGRARVRSRTGMHRRGSTALDGAVWALSSALSWIDSK